MEDGKVGKRGEWEGGKEAEWAAGAAGWLGC